MSSPVIYQPVPAPSGGILNTFEFAPWYAQQARPMLTRRPLTPWGVGMGLGGMDWDMVPPMGRMMVDANGGQGDVELEVMIDAIVGKEEETGTDIEHGDGTGAGEEEVETGVGIGVVEGVEEAGILAMRGGAGARRKGRRGRSENWRKARGGDFDEQLEDEDFDEELDDDDDLEEEGFMRRRGLDGRRGVAGWHGRGKNGRRRPPRTRGPMSRVADPGARTMFRRINQRMDGMDEKLMTLEDHVRATQEMRVRPNQGNGRLPMRYGGRDFGDEDDFDFGGGGGREPYGGGRGPYGGGRGPYGGVGGGRPGMPQRRPPFGQGRDPLDDMNDGGMGMGFGDDEGAPNQHGRPAPNENSNYQDRNNRPPDFDNHPRNAGPVPPDPSPQQNNPYAQRASPSHSGPEGLDPERPPSYAQGPENDVRPGGPQPEFPSGYQPQPHSGMPHAPPAPPPPGGFRPEFGAPGGYSTQGPPMPPGFRPRMQPPIIGRQDMGPDPGNHRDTREAGQVWNDRMEGLGGGPPLD
ncbi:MAG: hypothetical protein M1822_007746 [Bathelium mastoideum]|nr:MAG: hypothetical protein M1822_007746 [Bathelium mastoideum]